MSLSLLRAAAAASALLLLPLLAPGQSVTVTVDASKTIRVVDNRQFGMNTPFWDGNFTGALSTDSLTEMGTQFMRFGGGSASDQYNFATNEDITTNTPWAFNVDQFATKAQALGAQAIITTNYGSGTAQMAADYVKYTNVTNHYGFKYWEVGNECYGTWEYDTHAVPHDGLTYATNAAQYITQMKAVDPTVKVGVVVDASEDSYIEANAKPVTNPVTGAAHSGWTPIVLTQLAALGVYPDFVIYHNYPEEPLQENDATLLQTSNGTSSVAWPVAAAELRTQLNDYLGAAGKNVEILVTENNSVSYDPGKQSVSLVNGLYLADSTAALMQTEINGLCWWDFHNGQSTGSSSAPINTSASLYGWRLYGDYGVEQQSTDSTTTDRYPTFYVAKLLSHYARGGDTVVTATSSDPLLGAYAAKRADGSLSILVINKSPTATYTVNFSVAGFTPQGGETLYSYGMTQDNNAEAGSGSTDVAVTTATGASSSFSATFAPYSVTVLSLVGPTSAPTATTQPASQTIASGHTVTFSFPATGGPTPTFQWYLNGAAIAGATHSTLVVTGATAANAGTYTCTATNASGSITSSGATLTVVATANPGRLVNISSRAVVGTGSNIIFGGFAIGPRGLAGTETVLIRASGPALTAYSVPDVLPDPQLQLFNAAGAAIAGDLNQGWAGNAAIASAAATVGAFAWTSTTSHDAALLESLAPGTYTAQVSGESGDTGDALMEVYDDTANYTPADPRLINLSARVNVQTGAANALFVGFHISGETAMTVLIRVSGPALIPFGVTGTLPDPQLSLQTTAGTVLGTNAGWGGDAAVAAVASSVGAFPWSNGTSADSALLFTLAPGNSYNVVVDGVSGDAGAVLVEVYEIP